MVCNTPVALFWSISLIYQIFLNGLYEMSHEHIMSVEVNVILYRLLWDPIKWIRKFTKWGINNVEQFSSSTIKFVMEIVKYKVSVVKAFNYCW